MLPSTQRPRPGRRRPMMQTLPLSLSLLVILIALVSNASGRPEDSPHFRELAERGEIHVDTRPRPLNWLEKRQDTLDESFGEPSSSSSSAPAEPTSTSTSSRPQPTSTTPSEESATTTSNSTTTEIDIPTATTSDDSTSPSITVITTPLPSPFDTSLGNNFTSTSCPKFFTTFLSNATFRSCTPVSLLLQTSSSFFQAMRSPSLLTATLDTACSNPLSICDPLMTSFAQDLISDEHCGADFRNQQPLVLQAYNGLVAYEPVYRATCLKAQSSSSTSSDEDTNEDAYCFASAISTSPNPADIYPYLTAVGLNMPVGSEPTCNPCLKQTMQVFADYAVRREQPLAQTYLACASMVEGACGAGYVDMEVEAGSVDSGLENGRQGGEGNAAARSINGGGGVVAAIAALAALILL